MRGNKKIIFMLSLIIIAIISLSSLSVSEASTEDAFNITDNSESSLGESLSDDIINKNNQSDLNEENQQLILEKNNDTQLDSINDKIKPSNSNLNDSKILKSDSPGTFAELKAEIDNTPAGSVLYLSRDYEGAANTLVELDKDLTIEGNGHTIDCKNLEGCVGFISRSGRITLKNLRIINGHNDGSSAIDDYYGGAIIIKGSAQYTIENCLFQDNYADDSGGAIYCNGTGPLKIINCTFKSNKADDHYGGAIFINSNSELEIIDSTFIGNIAYRKGGAIYADIKLLKIKNSTFDSNRANSASGGVYESYGGAVYGNDIEIESSKFISNFASDYGGAIYAHGTLTVNANPNSQESLFSNNVANNDDGGAILAKGDVNIFNSRFTTNTAKEDGGAISAEEGTCRVNNCVFASNRAVESILPCYGGAIRGKIVEVYSCNFNNNFAENHGGAIYADSLTIDNTVPSSFVSNTAKKGKGGAIYADYLNENIMHLTLYDNSAAIDNSDDGGAIYINSENHITFSQCTLLSNHCGDEGGVIYLDSTSSSISLVNNIILANRAGDTGHVVFNKGSYGAIYNNWWGDINPSSNNGLLVEWKSLESNVNHVDSDPLRSQLKIEDNPVALDETARATYYFVKSDGSAFTGVLEAPVTFILPESIIKESEGKTQNSVYITFKGNKTGTYTITANLHGQMVSNTVTIIEKEKVDPNLSITVNNITEGQKPVAVITANNTLNTTMHVKINDSTTLYPVDIINGKGNVTIDEDLTVGEYTATIIFDGDDTFIPSNKSTTFTIEKEKIDPNLNIKVNNITEGQKPVAVITANNTLNTTMHVKINDSTALYPVDIINGEGNVTIDKTLAVGEYTATIIFNGDNTFIPSNKSTTFTIKEKEKIDPNLNIKVNNITEGEMVAAVITANNTLNATMHVKINDSTALYPVDIINGEGNVTIDKTLAAGEYTATIIFNGDNTFIPSNKSTTFTIKEKEKIDPNLNIKVNNITEGEMAVAVITANNTLNGMAEVKLNSSTTTYQVNIVNGTGNLTIDEILAHGEYEAKVIFNGDDTFKASEKTTTFTVKEKEKIDPNLNIKVNNITEGEMAVAVITANNTLNATMHVKINDSTALYPVDIINGKGNVTIDKTLAAGEYTATLIFNGDNTFIPSNKSTTFTVKERIKETLLNITSKDIKYGEEAIIGFTLRDIDGNNITGSIDVIMENNIQTVSIVDGVGTLRIKNLSAEAYTVVAEYAGNEKYTASEAISHFNVAKLGTQIICKDMTTTAVGSSDGRVGEWFNWTLVDEDGNPMPNIPMKIGFNGVVYDERNGIITDDNGNAKLQINLGYKGTYTFAIFYSGDENHNPTFIVSKITVKEQTPTLTVPNKSYKTTTKDKQLTATFKTSRGNPIAGKKITFTVNGKSYSATTNKNGVATVKVNLNKKGTYSFTAKFSGDSTYKSTSKTAKLTIK